MSEPHERLRAAREAAGYDSGSSAAKAFGWGESTYLGHENGSRGLRAKVAQVYAHAFSVEPEWLLYGDDDAPVLIRRIRQRLSETGQNPFSAALKAGLDRDHIRNILRGKAKNPGATNLMKVAAVLDVTPAWLMGQEEPSTMPGAPPATQARNNGIRLANGRVTLDLHAEVSPGVAAQILALIEGDKT